jgi:uncharacterized protein YaiL (DUF2058 family)
VGDSLKDQLISLGLSKPRPNLPGTKKRAGDGRRNRASPNRIEGLKPDSDENLSLAEAYRLRAREDKSSAGRSRQKKQAEERKRREINKKIKAIVAAHRLNDASADLARNFMYKGRIRKIFVTRSQLVQLNAGELGVVQVSGGYHLLAPEYVESIRQLSADHVPELGGSDAQGDGGDDEGEHPVPDDLIW